MNEPCCACEEAKYEVTFEGLWSNQTHPKDFPKSLWLLHFSDIIGASHSADYRYRFSYYWAHSRVSRGLKRGREPLLVVAHNILYSTVHCSNNSSVRITPSYTLSCLRRRSSFLLASTATFPTSTLPPFPSSVDPSTHFLKANISKKKR